MTPAITASNSSEAIAQAMGLSRQPATEKAPATETGANGNGTTTMTKADNTQSTEQNNGERKPIVVRKKEVQPENGQAKPAKKEVETKQEVAKLTISDEDFERTFNERLGRPYKEVTEVLSRFPQLEEQLKASPFALPELGVINDLVKKGTNLDTALQYVRADAAKMSSKDILALQMHVDNPEIPMEKILDRLDRKYQVGKYAPLVESEDGKTKIPDANHIATAEDDMLFDAAPIKKQFTELKEKMVANGSSRQTLAQQQAERNRIQGWEPITDQVFGEFKKIEVRDDKGVAFEYPVEMTAEEKSVLRKEFAVMVSQPGFDPNPINIQAAKQVVKDRYIGQHFSEIVLSCAEQARTMTNEQWIEFSHNPSIPGSGKKETYNKEVLTNDQKIAAAFNKTMSTKRRRSN